MTLWGTARMRLWKARSLPHQRLDLRRGQPLLGSAPTLRQPAKMLRIAADGGFKRIGSLARTGHNDFALSKVGEIAARHAEKPRKLRRGNLGRQHPLRVACHGGNRT